MTTVPAAAIILATALSVCGQRITTIQLDGVQYFISRMNPYAPELNYFLSYQFCRSIGLQLASFETQEKADSITQYLVNAGYNNHDYWTSGNRLGTKMLIWMSSGLTFNATFDYMRKAPLNEVESSTDGPSDENSTNPTIGIPPKPSVSRRSHRRDSRNGDKRNACVALKAPQLDWDTDDCEIYKDFICEQTRCYYYNYGSIPVSTSQGNNKAKPKETTTAAPDETNATFTSASNNDTPLGPLLNFTVNRRITLRPAARTFDSSTLPTVTDENPVPSDSPDPHDSSPGPDDNVVYVTAVGASSDQQAIAYVNMNTENGDQVSDQETTTNRLSDDDIV